MSPADLADLRRRKTGWGNGSAKADAADLAEKDRCDIVEYYRSCCFFLSVLFPCSSLMCLNGRSRVSRGNKMQKLKKNGPLLLILFC